MAEKVKAYYVERVSRTVTTVLVYASTGKEARANAHDGRGVEIDSRTTTRGVGEVHRAPEEDDFAPG